MFNNLILKIKKIIEDKNKKSLMILVLALFILLLTGVSFAYFSAQVKGGDNANINVATGTTDSLMFKSVQDIDLRVEVSDFGMGGDDLSREAISSASLKANNTTNQASSSYNAFLLIDNNDFVYTTNDYTPELVVKIYDPNGNEVTDIEGLKRIEGGFDITTRTGGFLIRSDYDINVTGNDTEIQEWKAEVTLVNLDSDQRGNMGKYFSARLYLTQEKLSTYELPLVNSININEDEKTFSSMIARMNVTEGTEEIKKYFFAIEEVESGIAYNIPNYGLRKLANTSEELDWKETDQLYYEFNNLKPNTAYKIYGYAMDKNDFESNMYKTEEPINTNEYLKPSILNVTFTNTLESITVNVSASKGDNKVVKYYYSINDGEYIERTENNYTFNNLKDTTSYKIKIKVGNHEEGFSTEFVKTNAETEKYILPNITKVDKVTTYNSATLTITATNGHGEVHGNYEISEYWYQINNGEWKEASNNVIRLNSLLEQAEYNVNIKVKDTYGKESVIYSDTVTTDAYKIPVVNSIGSTPAKNSLKITVGASAKEIGATLSKYYFSKDGGSNWSEGQASSSYTFSSLTPYTQFNIAVKVEDSNGRVSTISYKNDSDTKTLPDDFTNNSSDVTAIYDGSAKTFTPNVSPSATTIYYSTTTQLTTSNYTISGSPSGTHSRIKAGSDTVYWCAVKTGYNPLCSSNTITINKSTPTFTMDSSSVTIDSASTTTTVTYSYDGDGVVSCSPTSGTYASCSVNTTTKVITFTRKSSNSRGTQSFTINVPEGDNYNAVTGQAISVKVIGEPIPMSCSNGTSLATCIKNHYNTYGIDSDIYYHTSSLANSAEDNSYRYSGTNPNNYVCFGSIASTCPTNNLYRIIGVFENQVKLIKAESATSTLLGTNGDYIGFGKNYGYPELAYTTYYKGDIMYDEYEVYYWNASTGTSNWNESVLNKVNLNTNYVNKIGTTWASKIAMTAWKVGGVAWKNTNAVKQFYDDEIGKNSSNTTYNAKIGLLYVSDYGYGSTPDYWTKSFGDGFDDERYNGEDNWLNIGIIEWTITRSTTKDYYGDEYTDRAYAVTFIGAVDSGDIVNSTGYIHTARPAFYLNSNITYSSGSGTKSSPIRIN